MKHHGPIMYEVLPIDYMPVYRCYTCYKFFEQAPVTDDDGRGFCSNECLEDADTEMLINAPDEADELEEEDD